MQAWAAVVIHFYIKCDGTLESHFKITSLELSQQLRMLMLGGKYGMQEVLEDMLRGFQTNLMLCILS